MKTYICRVCGYIYKEAAGSHDGGIAPGTKWEDIPDGWTCPVCGASRDEFEEQMKSPNQMELHVNASPKDSAAPAELSFAGMRALFSNLSKGCEKQYRAEEAELFNRLAEYFGNRISFPEEADFSDIAGLIGQNLNTDYIRANALAAGVSDRGALRALTWGEKVTRILSSVLNRYEKQREDLLKDMDIHVCEICGFVYIGGEPPEICPVCKVPNSKIKKIAKEAV